MERVVKERMTIQDPEKAHAQRADQHPAGRRGHEGVLRRQPALPVHGPDEPAGRADPQAAPLGPRPRRPLPRARRLRRPRRPPQPLRAHLPDRDAGRPEHRPHRLAGHLRRASTSTASSRRRTARSVAASTTATRDLSADAGADDVTARRQGHPGQGGTVITEEAVETLRRPRRSRPSRSSPSSPTRSSTCRPTKRTTTSSPRPTRRLDENGEFIDEKIDRAPADQFPDGAARAGRLHGRSPKQIV